MSLLPVLAVLLSAQVAISDLYARRVSNRWLLCVGMVALGGLLWIWAVHGAPFPGMHLAGAVVGLAALLPIWVASSLLAGAHAGCVLLAPGLRTALPLRMQWLHARAQQQWQARPFVRQIHASRQGRAGIPYAAYLAFATVGFIAYGTYGASS